jgi:predicted 3-demethylubiquinone-9 3-methyltransferase (glyoxalase superfamily)
MSRISPFLWFDSEAQEAVQFYVSLFENSSITNLTQYPDGTTFGISFVLDGLECQAMNAGPGHPFTDAISLFTRADTQQEIDRLWDAFSADGGEAGPCGWVKDRWGLWWQIVPPILGQLLGDADAEKAGRTMKAMMAMGKIDIAGLQAAHDG